MNKQELIKKIKELKYHNASKKSWIDRELVLDLVKQLDEPQRVVVPQFVADWYEENKDDFEGNLFRCINTISSMYEDEELNEFENWVIEANTEPFQTLVNMHQFGYTVEEEKRYVVKAKGILAGNNFLNYYIPEKIWSFSTKTESTLYKTKHTHKELEEAGFGEVFNSTLFEVEEVE